MSKKRIHRLRDKLLERGRPTLYPGAGDTRESGQAPPMSGESRPAASPELNALAERVKPFAEVMYLVLAADKAISDRERALLRGGLRSLTDGALSTAAMADMMDEFERSRERDGVDMRLDFVASALYADRADARLALGLATAAADADRGIGTEERALIDALGERLGISRVEVQEMLQGATG
jgi:tellurite resistance protein